MMCWVLCAPRKSVLNMRRSIRALDYLFTIFANFLDERSKWTEQNGVCIDLS